MRKKLSVDGNERLCAVGVGTFVSIDDDRVEKTRF